MQVKRLDPAVCYYLHPDARFFRPGELLGQKHAAEIGEDNYVLSCPATRARSKVVSRRIHSLLQRFHTGARVSEAILACAREHAEDPRHLLQAYLPVLQDLQQWNYLCEAPELPRQEDVPPEKVRFDLPGFLPGRVLKKTTESIVAEAFAEGGARVCIKQLAAGASALEREKIVNEAKMLRVLAGLDVSEVLAFAPESPSCGLATSWAGRFSAKDAFSGALGVGIVVDGDLALRTAISILRSFEAIHARGVLHSDIHHNNLRFAELGRWTVIDFGLAFTEGSAAASTPLLEAVAQFLAPEQLPSREGDPYRRPERRSEQYSLAALFFFLLSGEHYLDFRLETAAVIAQIKDELPRALVLRNGEAVGGVDAVFRRALSKDPAQRYASVGDFADAIAAAHAAARTPPRSDAAAQGRNDGLHLSGCASLLSPERAILCQGEIFGVAGCLNLGLAALAFASLHHDPRYLDGALIWGSRARHLKETPGIFSEELRRSVRLEVPLFIGTACLHELPLAADLALLAIDHAASGVVVLDAGFEEALWLEAEQNQRWDFVNGHACLLNALAYFVGVGCTEATFQEVGSHLYEKLALRLANDASGENWKVQGAGLAHGRAGVLYAMLRWSQANGRDADETLRRALQDFMSGLTTGADTESTRHFGSAFVPPSLSWWCNGLSGIAGLLDLAHQTAPGAVDAPLLAAAAIKEAQTCPPSVNHICCGHAGVAMTRWQIARMTGNAALRVLAQDALEAARVNLNPLLGSEVNLLKGDLGIAVVGEAMRCERRVSVPLFVEL